jgi:hypothetical protein
MIIQTGHPVDLVNSAQLALRDLVNDDSRRVGLAAKEVVAPWAALESGDPVRGYESRDANQLSGSMCVVINRATVFLSDID